MTTGTFVKSRLFVWLLCGVVAAAAFAAGAALVMVRQAPGAGAADPDTQTVVQATITVAWGSVEEVLVVPATVERDVAGVGTVLTSGVVTEIDVHEPRFVDSGAQLFKLDGTPVFATVGTTPHYRTLKRGSTGPDVAQLNEMLSRLGFDIDGTADRFTGVTEDAVREWQSNFGLPVTGVVEEGRLMAVPDRAVVTATSGLVLGRPINRGDIVFHFLGRGRATVRLSNAQLLLKPAAVELDFEGASGMRRTLKAALGDLRAAPNPDQASRQVEVTDPSGGALCSDTDRRPSCDDLPREAEVRASARLVILERVEGVVVPMAFIRVAQDGQTYVVAESGQVPVVIEGAANGQAVVQGLDVGATIVLSE